MTTEPVVFEATIPQQNIALSGLGRVRVQAPSIGAELATGWRASRPTHTNYHAYANALIAACVEPALGAAKQLRSGW